ncbi:MAG: ATP-binding protein [Sedimentisphaerales bacterium]|nr:ATP-binding protein [Sedimentisphaerales bacterium]HOH65611.1 ATP-binding protein [Sedimentisphaerales bacterium]HQA90999.1 ATP-binding protein [Sedimentisphaerales bacterium]HQN36023.1 ATP-binding protein [Sedimentisphaerales bacterium]
MEIIRAKVNERLLSKAERLFTGAVEGRIIEILQNARRAGAAEVHIINSHGQVTVRDNGRGIADFAALLDLGRSDWDDRTEYAEDPAGVGVFCLAPREVCITSGDKKVVVKGNGWTGEPVEVLAADRTCKGTELVFGDQPWLFETVQKHAVFSGLNVTVDSQMCAREPFVSDTASAHPELGCRIEVRERNALSQWHTQWKHSYYADDVLVNFHGQVVAFTDMALSEHLQFLVDLTGEPTGIRLMLPARTRLVENEALEVLKAAIEKEAYLYIQKRGSHKLKFSEYRRAKELGIELPEAEPVFQTGLLTGEPVEPIEVTRPKDFPLARCYRLAKECMDADEANEANAHLLSALGTFESPFVVVDISPDYDGYTWARLPTIEQVEIKTGKEIQSQYLWCERLVAVDSLQITAHASDGKAFTSVVPMAIREYARTEGPNTWVGTDVLVTPAARDTLSPTYIWYQLGGFSEDGDTYDTQLEDFEEQLNRFWAELIGPDEYLRQRLLECIRDFNLKWRHISVESSGKVWITCEDGTARMLQPPEISSAS